jgi:hypothetical protein
MTGSTGAKVPSVKPNSDSFSLEQKNPGEEGSMVGFFCKNE